jgi:hypothetical protein
MKSIYISGKITGDKNYRKKFFDAEVSLYEAGYYPKDPASCTFRGEDWGFAMRTVLRLMLLSDGVALLPDWEESKGAKIEERLAREVGLPVKPIAEWIKGETP